MGKSDEKPTKSKRAHKATTDGESKHKNKPSCFDATTFEATDDDDLRHSRWCDNFRKLCEYKVEHGDCLVPRHYAANPKLGAWVKNQRRTYKLYQEERPTAMTEERIRALESISFNWGTTKAAVASVWYERFQELREFKVQFGHCIVPRHYAPKPKLGHWMSRQRRQYRLHQEGKPSPMTEVRIRELESLGFDWGTSKTALASMWNVRFQQLCEFKEQFGNYVVPFNYTANPQLGQWVSHQRTAYKFYQEGKPSPITEERIRELESVGFEWKTKWSKSKTGLASIWSVGFQEMCEFKAKYGHCLVPQRYAANPELGSWVKVQRANYRLHHEGKSSSMTEERIQDLESVGFEWGKSKIDFTSIWSERFQQMCEFKAEFGHCLVSSNYSANPKLGAWVKLQRSNYRWYQKGKPSGMTEERIRDLESVGFDWNSSKKKTDLTSIWSERFQQMREFKAQFGHCLVPQRYAANPKLGGWVKSQRSNYKFYHEGKPSPMTEERIQKLESAGFKF